MLIERSIEYGAMSSSLFATRANIRKPFVKSATTVQFLYIYNRRNLQLPLVLKRTIGFRPFF